MDLSCLPFELVCAEEDAGTNHTYCILDIAQNPEEQGVRSNGRTSQFFLCELIFNSHYSPRYAFFTCSLSISLFASSVKTILPVSRT